MEGFGKKMVRPGLSDGPCSMALRIENADMLLFRYMCKTLDRQESIETDFADPLVTDLIKLAGSVSREAEYVRQFVRFRKTRDGYYYAPVATKI